LEFHQSFSQEYLGQIIGKWIGGIVCIAYEQQRVSRKRQARTDSDANGKRQPEYQKQGFKSIRVEAPYAALT